MTDRAALESATDVAEGLIRDDSRKLGTYVNISAAHLHQLCCAARAHLETLPKTKMVEKFYVLSVSAISSVCYVDVCDDRIAADATADRMRENLRLVRVTGPHLHEVPAT